MLQLQAGYFDLNLDFTEVDVSLTYTITLSVHEDSVVSDLVPFEYYVDDPDEENAITLDPEALIITDSIYYSNNTDSKSYRIYIKWNDDTNSGAIMNNIDDTNTTIAEPNVEKRALLNVNLHFEQLPNDSEPPTP